MVHAYGLTPLEDCYEFQPMLTFWLENPDV